MSRIHLRMAGYVATIVLHVTNGLYMTSFHQGAVMEDPEIRAFVGLQYRFVTCWNFIFQIIYAIIGLTCDWLTLKQSSNNKYKLPYILSETRDTLYAAIIWPSSIQVATLFWPFYLYDIRLVYPTFIWQVLTPLSNHVIHSAIVPIALWEMLLRPQKEPKSHAKPIAILTVYTLLYFFVLFYTYVEQGAWIYPIFKYAYQKGTIYVSLIVCYACILLVINYKLQWFLVRLLYPTKLANVNTYKKIK